MRIKLIALLLCLLLVFTGCSNDKPLADGRPGEPGGQGAPGEAGDAADLGGDDTSFGEDLGSLGAADGYFEGESSDIVVECLSGTAGAYTLEGTTLTFTAVSEASVYSISGTLKGNIIIDTGEGYKFDLELHGFSLVCDSTSPILIKSGDEVAIKAKRDTKNYIYDKRAAIDEADESLHSGAIHSEVDLEVGGKGELTVISDNNNGIHTKDDLQLKNLTLLVSCRDNALKGNDSVEIESGSTTLIASAGDCIKTSSSDVSEKGNQRGSVTFLGGTHTLYAACDGIDAAYNVVIEGDTVLNIYTDKYSNYSENVTVAASDVNYIRFTSNAYCYSVKYYNSDNDFVWVNAEYHSTVSGSRSSYYYYSYPKKPEYEKQQFFIYESAADMGQDENYLVASDYLAQNTAYDTFALTSRGYQLSYSWTNYTTKITEGGPGGFGGGGMQDGNTDKGEYSTKGIKAANGITVSAGTVNIKSYDDAIHANCDTALENGETPTGNVTVSGGSVTVYSNDDGLHADGKLLITGGSVSVTNSYEGLEGSTVAVSGGYVSVRSKDDGINATAVSGASISISGGTLYIYCSGDGIDSNSRASYQGIVFSGGRTVVISTSGGNSAIDSEQGYTYEGGAVVAVMPRGGMSNEATHCQSFSSVGCSTQLTLGEGSFIVAEIGGDTATVRVPTAMSAYVIILGDSSADVKSEDSSSAALDSNGVAWN